MYNLSKYISKARCYAGFCYFMHSCLSAYSHINSVPRKSLNNQSPFEAGQGFIGINNINKLGIVKIPYDDVNLTIRLLRK